MSCGSPVVGTHDCSPASALSTNSNVLNFKVARRPAELEAGVGLLRARPIGGGLRRPPRARKSHFPHHDQRPSGIVRLAQGPPTHADDRGADKNSPSGWSTWSETDVVDRRPAAWLTAQLHPGPAPAETAGADPPPAWDRLQGANQAGRWPPTCWGYPGQVASLAQGEEDPKALADLAQAPG